MFGVECGAGIAALVKNGLLSAEKPPTADGAKPKSGKKLDKVWLL